MLWMYGVAYSHHTHPVKILIRGLYPETLILMYCTLEIKVNVNFRLRLPSVGHRLSRRLLEDCCADYRIEM